MLTVLPFGKRRVAGMNTAASSNKNGQPQQDQQQQPQQLQPQQPQQQQEKLPSLVNVVIKGKWQIVSRVCVFKHVGGVAGHIDRSAHPIPGRLFYSN